MAITLDKALGSGSINGATASFATGAAVASGARVVVCVSWFNAAATTPAVSVGGSTPTLDKQFDNGSDHFAIFSIVEASGLASGSTISASLTGNGGNLLAACSYLGITGVGTTSTNATTGTGFSSGAASNAVADALFVGGAGNETATTSVGGTNTNGTSRFDIWNSGSQQGMRMLDLIASSVANQALTGTWGVTSSATTGALVIYSGTAAAAAAGRAFTPGRMPLGA